jgi:hypothetical protein
MAQLCESIKAAATSAAGPVGVDHLRGAGVKSGLGTCIAALAEVGAVRVLDPFPLKFIWEAAQEMALRHFGQALAERRMLEARLARLRRPAMVDCDEVGGFPGVADCDLPPKQL